MVNASRSNLAFSSILHDMLSVLFGPFQTCNRATGFKVFLNPHLIQEKPCHELHGIHHHHSNDARNAGV